MTGCLLVTVLYEVLFLGLPCGLEVGLEEVVAAGLAWQKAKGTMIG